MNATGMTQVELKARIVDLAREVGFDSCRVATCSPPAHAKEFADWLSDGAHGEMHYMARGEEKRRDPQNVLPGARSVIVLALNYFIESGKRKTESGNYGRIARYAWGDDYHDVIAAKLKKIDNFLRKLGGEQKCYVDTGPILERDYAATAGIGWHGKSTMLLNRELGTWFFLSEILTTLELPPDPPQVARCGSCTRCIDACPTGAITAPHRLDARLCISYLTIELKGSIPTELRPLIGDRIFGCDDCLDACPWNRFAKRARETAFAARPRVMSMRLRDFLGLDDRAF
ncbi:MAG TPA: tRNA epoxyqueuosine(34) reductase QueG, partial [Chthoniobacterales bacterium]